MPNRRRLVPLARSAGIVLGVCVVVMQALWMLLLGLAMSYGTPLGAPDSIWRGAAGVAMGCAAVLFGAGVATLGWSRRRLGAASAALGSAIYTAVYLGYPGLSDADAWAWVSLAAPWAATAAVAAIAWGQDQTAGGRDHVAGGRDHVELPRAA
jgi:hypothetical protein